MHPYADTPAHVLAILRNVRRTLRQEHQTRLPMFVTETGWTSSQGHTVLQAGIETTPAGQASNLAAEYPLLVANRQALDLAAVYWYTWIGAEPSSDQFQYSGLLRLTPGGRVQVKPAFRAYDRTLRRLERMGRPSRRTR